MDAVEALLQSARELFEAEQRAIRSARAKKQEADRKAKGGCYSHLLAGGEKRAAAARARRELLRPCLELVGALDNISAARETGMTVVRVRRLRNIFGLRNPLRKISAHNATRRDEADSRAAELAPIFAEIRWLSANYAARALDRMGVPTCKGGRWHAASVRRIRERLAKQKKES